MQEDEIKSEKDKETMEKIKKKEKKIQNMQEENKRIFMKENSQDGGLTEGQSACVDRNDKNIAVLEEEIEKARQLYFGITSLPFSNHFFFFFPFFPFFLLFPSGNTHLAGEYDQVQKHPAQGAARAKGIGCHQRNGAQCRR